MALAGYIVKKNYKKTLERSHVSHVDHLENGTGNLVLGGTSYFKCKCEFVLDTIVWPFCQIPHHDMEVNVLAGLLSGKKCEVLQLHLAGVVQHGARVKTSLRDGHVVFDPWWNE